MRHSEAEILETLTGGGASLDDFFVVDGLAMQVPDPKSEICDAPLALIIEIDSLAEDCVQYLLERGAPHFESMGEWLSSCDSDLPPQRDPNDS